MCARLNECTHESMKRYLLAVSRLALLPLCVVDCHLSIFPRVLTQNTCWRCIWNFSSQEVCWFRNTCVRKETNYSNWEQPTAHTGATRKSKSKRFNACSHLFCMAHYCVPNESKWTWAAQYKHTVYIRIARIIDWLFGRITTNTCVFEWVCPSI